VTGTSQADTRRWVGIAGALLALVVVACAGLLVGHQLGSATPGESSVEAGFARDMQVHHAQAAEMSYLVIVATEDETIRSIAYDILTTQQAQIGIMSGWLHEWDLPAHSSAPLMEWMGGTGDGGHGHDMAGMEPDDGAGDGGDDVASFEPHDGAVMPGMATDTEMEQLRSSTGREAEVLFLRLMIAHHRAGVEMADYAAEHVEDEDVRSFAERMGRAQESEIRAMNDLLEERGEEPV
jgi:uncharacterized protein (DUF305 family)